MIQINDDDLPITAAEKIINGTRPTKLSPLQEKLAENITGNLFISDLQDMFSVEKIREIGLYLIVYSDCHKEGD